MKFFFIWNHNTLYIQQKFQEVSAAYKKLTTTEKDFDEDRMTLVSNLLFNPTFY